MAGVTTLRKSSIFARRFARSDRGATAVEFAIVAAPFLALLGGVVELGLVFMASVSLDNAMMIAARKVRTGQNTSPVGATAQETSRVAFRDEICANMGWMQTDCQSKLYVDVRPYAQFQDVTVANPISNGTFNAGALKFDTGSACTIVLVRAYYRWSMYMPLMNTALVKVPGETLLTSVATFRTEPYSTTPC